MSEAPRTRPRDRDRTQRGRRVPPQCKLHHDAARRAGRFWRPSAPTRSTRSLSPCCGFATGRAGRRHRGRPRAGIYCAEARNDREGRRRDVAGPRRQGVVTAEKRLTVKEATVTCDAGGAATLAAAPERSILHAPAAGRPARRTDPSLPAAMPLLLQPAGAGARQRRAQRRGMGRDIPSGGRDRRRCNCIFPAASRRCAAISTRSCKHAVDAGLYTNLVTAAVLLTRERLGELAEIGLDHVQVSIQDVDSRGQRRPHLRLQGRRRQESAIVARLGARAGPAAHNQRADAPPQHRPSAEAIIDFAVEVGAQRLEVAHIQYYAWAEKNRAALIPTREKFMTAAKVVEKARERLTGVILDFVVHDHYAKLPKACMGGWGRSIIDVTPSGRVLALPRRRNAAGPRVRQRARTRARLTSGRRSAFENVPRHGLDEGALPLLRPARDRLRRLPLSGLRGHGRRRPIPTPPARSRRCILSGRRWRRSSLTSPPRSSSIGVRAAPPLNPPRRKFRLRPRLSLPRVTPDGCADAPA